MRAPRTLAAAALACGSLLFGHPRSAAAQTAAELAEGRRLFTEAFADEEQGRFAAALEKYKRVQEVRDTPNVRFRMAASLEGLGKLTRAAEGYAAAIKLGTESGAAADVVRGAQARLAVLQPKMAHLALRLANDAWPDAEVAVDGDVVAREALADVSVDPGSHVVTATARGAAPFRAQIALSEGGRMEVPVALQPVVVPVPAPAHGLPPSEAPPREGASPYRTIGIATAAAGGAFLVGGAIVFVLRHSAIATLDDSCPDGHCPPSRESELRATRDRATFEGPLGAALVSVGAAAVGTGLVVLVLSSRDASTASTLAPAITAHGTTVTFRRAF